MLDVRDISAGNFQGNIFLVYEDKPTNNKIVEVLKSKKVFEGKVVRYFTKLLKI